VNFRNSLTIIAVFSLLSISFTSWAGNVAAGKEKSGTCQGCHGADGNSYGPEWPHLAGQHANYMVGQVKAFQEGVRTDPTMSAMVAGISMGDIEDIAAYFESQAITTKEEKGKAKIVAAGKALYKGGNRYKSIPACAGCHSPTGKGNRPGAIPNLAGQRVLYTVKSLKDFRSGTRNNDVNSIMQNVAENMTDKDIKAVAAYIAELQ